MIEAEGVVEAEEVAGVEPAVAVDRAGIQAVAAVEGADSILRAAVGGRAAADKAAAGIADIPEGDNLEVGRAWAGPAPSSSWHAPPLPLST